MFIIVVHLFLSFVENSSPLYIYRIYVYIYYMFIVYCLFDIVYYNLFESCTSVHLILFNVATVLVRSHVSTYVSTSTRLVNWKFVQPNSKVSTKKFSFCE